MRNRFVKPLFVVICITGVLLLDLGSPAPGRSEKFWNGTVTANMNLRKAPSTRGTIIKGLLKGSPVKIYEEQDGWYRVSAQKYHQVFRGWVSIDFVEITTEEPSVASTVAEVPVPEPQAQRLPPSEEGLQPAPVAEVPAPELQTQPLPPAEKSLQSAPVAAAEKPLPPPVEETAPPAPESQPVVVPEPEPEKRAVEKPPETKPAAPEPERPPRVEKAPVVDPAASPADDWLQMLPMALPVVAIIILLIAVIVYRLKRASGKKAEGAAAPIEWPTPQESSDQVPKDKKTFEESLRPMGAEELNEPFEEVPSSPHEEAPSPSTEEELDEPFEEDLRPSLEEELGEPFEEDLSPSLEEDLGEPLEEDLSPSFEEELGDPFEEDLSPSLEEELGDPFEEDLSPSLEEELGEPFEEELSPLLEKELGEPSEEDLSLSLEEALGEPFEEDLSPSLEEKPSEPSEEDLSRQLEADLSAPLEEDLSPPPEEEPSESSEKAQDEPLEKAPVEGLDFQMESTPTGSVSGSKDTRPTRSSVVYNQVVEIINRMSDAELTKLLYLVNSQLGKKSRQDDRLTFYTMVDFVVDGQYYRDFIQDLSVSGVFIKGRHMFEPGQLILMSFMSPFFQKPFKISGEIVRILDTGIGVKFDKESQVQSEALSSLIKQISMLAESG